MPKLNVYGKEQPPQGNHLHQRQGGGGLRQADTFRDEQARERAESHGHRLGRAHLPRQENQVVSPKVCNFQQKWTFFTSSRIELNFSSPHLKLFSYLCTQLIRNTRFFHISPTKPIASAGKLVGNSVLYLLRERKGLGNLAILLWRTLLQQRFECLAQRGSDVCEISFAQPVCVLRK